MATTNTVNPSTGVRAYQVPGAAPASGFIASPSQVSNAIVSALPNQGATTGGGGAIVRGQNVNSAGQVTGAANPKDIPGNPANPLVLPGQTPNAAALAQKQTATNTTSPAIPGQVTATTTDLTNPASGSTDTNSATDANGQPVDPLKSKYTQALNDLQKTGVASPVTPGSAQAGVKTALNSQTPSQPAYDSTQTDALLASNEAHQQYLQDYTQAQTSQASAESLTQTYTDLSNQLGLPAINSKLMNINAIINGTEQNIRDEVTASGGFATESQVQALAVSRNKTLIQQQKELQATKDNLTTNLTTMIGLAEKDRTYAQQQITDQLNFDQKQIEFSDKAVTNAQSSLKDMVASEGWSGVYKAALATGDPQAVQRINAVMGPGFNLANVAQNDTSQQAKQLDLQSKELGIQNSQLDIQKKKQDINDTAGVPNPAKAGQSGYTDTGIKYTPAVATQEVNNLIKQQGLTGTKGLLAPADYNRLKSSWVQNGLKDSDFDSIYGGMKDPKLASNHVYN